MTIRTFFLLILVFPVTIQAAQTCKPNSIPASTPDSQLIDNGDGTVTDNKTGLMWKKCLEGFSGALCETGTISVFTWQAALTQPIVVNNGGGFAGYIDWRLPNIRELLSIVEEQCSTPAINIDRFPNIPSLDVWSGSPHAGYPDSAWRVDFEKDGDSIFGYRSHSYAVRLVRGGD